MFDTMVVDEAKIRLGEEGWKERYYQVSCWSSSLVASCKAVKSCIITCIFTHTTDASISGIMCEQYLQTGHHWWHVFKHSASYYMCSGHCIYICSKQHTAFSHPEPGVP